MGRAPCCEDKEGHLKKGAWTAEEDEKLVSFIQTNKGHGSWRTLPKLAGLERCGKSCRLRWTNYLRPNIKRGHFTPEEERIIIQLHALVGNKWSSIASHLPGRTDNEVKNHWNTHLKKRLAKMGIDPTTHLPLRHVQAAANYYSALGLSTQPAAYSYSHTSNIADDWKRALLQRCLQLDPSNMACHLVQWELARLEAEARVKLAAASSHEYMQNYVTWLQSCAVSMSSRGLLQAHDGQQPLSNNYNVNEYQLQLLQLAAANSTSSDSGAPQLPQLDSPYSDSHAHFLKQQLNEDVRSINKKNHSLDDPAYNYNTCMTSSPPANLFNYLSSTSSPFSEENLPQLDMIHDSTIRKVPIYTSTHSGIATPDTSCSSETSTSHEVNIVSEYDQLQLMNPDDDHLSFIDTAALVPQPAADPPVNLLRRPQMSSPSDSLISDQTANSLNDSYWNKMLGLLGHATSFDNF